MWFTIVESDSHLHRATSSQVRPWSLKQSHTKLTDIFFVMSTGDEPSEEAGPSIQYHRHRDGQPRPVLLNFSSITIGEGTKWQTLAISRPVWRRRREKKESTLSHSCFVETTWGQTQNNPHHFISSSRHRWDVACNIFMGRLWKTWVFVYNMHPIILWHSSTLVFFSRNHREIPFLAHKLMKRLRLIRSRLQ